MAGKLACPYNIPEEECCKENIVQFIGNASKRSKNERKLNFSLLKAFPT
jgi:hypothetical protein